MLEKYSISRVNLRIKLIVIFFTVFKIICKEKFYLSGSYVYIYYYKIMREFRIMFGIKKRLMVR